MKLLLIDGFILTILGLCSAVENVIELLAIITSEALGNGTSIGKVTLNELNDGIGKESSVSSIKESGLRENLINAADASDCASLYEILAKVTTDETSTTKNKNCCHIGKLFKKSCLS